MFSLRVFLLLSRGTSLPTIWSHCLAGWWLSGTGAISSLPWLLCGATFLYLGGSFLTDAFDASYDAEHQRARPIPSGYVSSDTVWMWGWTWFALGIASLFVVGKAAGILGLVLVAWILMYSTTHRAFTLSVVLLGFCRFMLYLLGGSASSMGINGWTIWCGLALAMFFVGATYASKQATTRWSLLVPAVLMMAPVVLSLLMNGNAHRREALLLSAVLVLWVLLCARRLLWPDHAQTKNSSSGLLPGLVLVDWLSSADAPQGVSSTFIALFITAVLLEKVPSARSSAPLFARIQ